MDKISQLRYDNLLIKGWISIGKLIDDEEVKEGKSITERWRRTHKTLVVIYININE